MPFNGTGVFNRIYSWVADRNAGIDISASRMDQDTNDIATGLTDCITRDGQSLPTANLPMGNFRHTGASNAVNRQDYAALGQVQDGIANWVVAGGTSDAITANYSNALTALVDGELCNFRALSANATTAPTFAPNALPAQVITKLGGGALGVGDIAGSLAEVILRYNSANTRWELLNPSNNSIISGVAQTGFVSLTMAVTPPSGWIMFDDGTFGSASSGSSNRANSDTKALFLLLFSNIPDAFAPLFTSSGVATTRPAQGSGLSAWNANCRMSLPKTLGRVLGVAGTGSGLTTKFLGQTVGEETHELVLNEIPSGITSFNSSTISVSVSSTKTDVISLAPAVFFGNVQSGTGGGLDFNGSPTTAQLTSTGTLGVSSVGVTSNNTGNQPHNNMQPSSFLNALAKL